MFSHLARYRTHAPAILAGSIAASLILWANFFSSPWEIRRNDICRWPITAYSFCTYEDGYRLEFSLLALSVDILVAIGTAVGLVAALEWQKFAASKVGRGLIAAALVVLTVALAYKGRCGCESASLPGACLDALCLFGALGCWLLLSAGVRYALRPAPRLQFHLGTALVVMLLAGMLTFANARRYATTECAFTDMWGNHHVVRSYAKGWPLPFHEWECDKDEYSQTNLALDCVMSLFILLAAGAVCESRQKKFAPTPSPSEL
jgi:hypothetical protein